MLTSTKANERNKNSNSSKKMLSFSFTPDFFCSSLLNIAQFLLFHPVFLVCCFYNNNKIYPFCSFKSPTSAPKKRYFKNCCGGMDRYMKKNLKCR